MGNFWEFGNRTDRNRVGGVNYARTQILKLAFSRTLGALEYIINVIFVAYIRFCYFKIFLVGLCSDHKTIATGSDWKKIDIYLIFEVDVYRM